MRVVLQLVQTMITLVSGWQPRLPMPSPASPALQAAYGEVRLSPRVVHISVSTSRGSTPGNATEGIRDVARQDQGGGPSAHGQDW